MLDTEIIKNNLVERYGNFDQLKENMFQRAMDRFGTTKERELGKLDAALEVAINQIINNLKKGYQEGDEIWLWVENPDAPFAETWGYSTIRNGEPIQWEIVGRR